MLTRRAKRFCALTAAITASTGATGPAITVCRGETYPATLTSGIVGDQRRGGLGVQVRVVPPRPARPAATSAGTG